MHFIDFWFVLVYLCFVFVFGLIVGSFLNVIIVRLRSGEKWWKGFSFCPQCKHKLGIVDLIPVLGFLLRKGKCHYCSKSINIQYPLVELTTAILFVFVFYFRGLYSVSSMDWLQFFHLLLDFFIISVSIVVFVYDLRYYLILDKVLIPSMIIVLASRILLGGDIWQIALGALIGFGFFWLQFIISRGKWIGGGDIRLGLFMGICLGFYKLLLALFLSYVIGSIVVLVLIGFKKKGFGEKVPFGTFLTFSLLIAYFFGNSILDWYLGLILF